MVSGPGLISARDKAVRALVQAERLEPRHQIFSDDELPWQHLEDVLKRYEKLPEDVLSSLGLDSETRNELAS